jgi:hypothetical protein
MRRRNILYRLYTLKGYILSILYSSFPFFLLESKVIIEIIVRLLNDPGPLANDRLCIGGHRECANHIHSTLHSQCPVQPGMPPEVQQMVKDTLAGRLKWIDGELAGKQYLMGDTFTVADGYLFNVTNWAAQKSVYHELEAMYNLSSPEKVYIV